MDSENDDTLDDKKVYNIDRVLSFFSEPLVGGSAKYQTNLEKQKMPAIVTSEGTAGRIKMAERPMKAPQKQFRKVSALLNKTKSSNLFENGTNIVKDTNSNITIKIEGRPQPESATDLSFSQNFENKDDSFLKLIGASSFDRDINKQSSEDLDKSASADRPSIIPVSDQEIEDAIQKFDKQAKQFIEEKHIGNQLKSLNLLKQASMHSELLQGTIKTISQNVDNKIIKTNVVFQDPNINDVSKSLKNDEQLTKINKMNKYLHTKQSDSESFVSEDPITITGIKPLPRINNISKQPKEDSEPATQLDDYAPHVHNICQLDYDPEILLTHKEIESTKSLHQKSHSNQRFSSWTCDDKPVTSPLKFFPEEKPSVRNCEIYKQKLKRSKAILDASKLDPLDIEGWKQLVEKEFNKIDYTLHGHKSSISAGSEFRTLMNFIPPKMMLNPTAAKTFLFPKYFKTEKSTKELIESCEDTEDFVDMTLLDEKPEPPQFNLKVLFKKNKSEENLFVETELEMKTNEFIKLNRSSSLPNFHFVPDPSSVIESLAKSDYETAMQDVEKQKKILEAVRNVKPVTKSVDIADKPDSKVEEPPDKVHDLPQSKEPTKVISKKIDLKKNELKQMESPKIDKIKPKLLKNKSVQKNLKKMDSEKADVKDAELKNIDPKNTESKKKVKKLVEPLEPSQPKDTGIKKVIADEVVIPKEEKSNIKLKKLVWSKKSSLVYTDDLNLSGKHIKATDKLNVHAEQSNIEKNISKRRSRNSKKQKRSRKSLVNQKHWKVVAEKLLASYTPKKYKRSQSLNLPFADDVERPHLRRVASISDELDFKWFIKKQNREVNQIEDMREWVRGIWNEWFDEVFPPSEHSDSDTDDKESFLPKVKTQKKKTQKVRIMDVIPSVVSNIDVNETKQRMEDEKENLTNQLEGMESFSKPRLALYLVRRATLNRKLGKIKEALDDIQEALRFEPKLPQAYWQRHLIWLVHGDKQKALEDLNASLKLNKNDVAAYRSRGDIFSSMGDTTMAIVNYSQAIKLQPKEPNTYFQRALMFEQTGEMLLAMDDYENVTKLDPFNVEAITKRGLFYFKTNLWMKAISCFDNLIRNPGYEAMARCYRGQAYAKLGQMNLSLIDLSASIHLDPTNALAFYIRGASLRKAAPKKALQDLSTSLMLDDSEENVLALLHRGILYTELNRPLEALADFRQTLVLDHSIVCARISIGIILLETLKNPKEAARQFSIAIKSNPSYLRSYLCRADTFIKLNKYNEAANDLIRAIRINPTDHQLYLRLGRVMLHLKRFDLATYFIRRLASIEQSLPGASLAQKAIMQTFLNNYDEAVKHLTSICLSNPTVDIHVLLAKTLIKAKRYQEAIESLSVALKMCSTFNRSKAANVHFLIAICHKESLHYEEAIQSLNISIKLHPGVHPSYYERGFCRLMLKKSRGIEDVNMSLSIQPNQFDAFLLRAAYFSNKGKHSKAILNCNEALTLQPNSIRALLYRATAKFEIEAYKLAIYDLTKIIQLNKTCVLAFYNRGVVFQTLNQMFHAIKDYSTALYLMDSHFEELFHDKQNSSDKKLEFYCSLRSNLFVNRALIYLSKPFSDYQNSAEDLTEALLLSPQNILIAHTKALCLHKLLQLEEALEAYDQCLEIDPYYLPALLGKGDTYLDAKSIVAAHQEYMNVLQIDPSFVEARVHIGFSLQACGYYKHAWSHFTEALKIEPRCQSAFEGRAIASLFIGKLDSAYSDIRNALKVGARSARTLTLQGVIFQCFHSLDSALSMYKQAIQTDDDYWPAHFNAATIYFQNRRFKEAFSCYSDVLEIEPNYAPALMNRAVTSVFLNETETALEDFNDAVYNDPTNSFCFYNRGCLHLILKNYRNAEDDFTAALDINPNDFVSMKQRADVRGKLGNKVAAIHDYHESLVLYEIEKMNS